MPKKPKVCYFVSDPKRIRCVQTIPETNDFSQMVICPYFENDKMNNHFTDIKIQKVINFNKKSEAFKLIENINPNIVLVDRFDDVKSYPFKSRFFNLSHGEKFPLSKLNFKKNNKSIRRYKNFEKYLGGSVFSEKFLTQNVNVNIKNIFFKNAMPQLDIVKNRDIIGCYPPGCKNIKSVLFMGHVHKSFCHNNILDFFDILFYLSDLAKKNTFKLFVKPRVGFGGLLDALTALNLNDNSYLKKLKALKKNSNIEFIDLKGHPYRYYSADAIIGNSSSTVEVEASYGGIPYVRIMLRDKQDHFLVRSCKSSFVVESLPDLDKILGEIFAYKNSGILNSDKDYLNSIGLNNSMFVGENVLKVIKESL